MKYYQYTIVFQEMPDDIALTFELTQCPVCCEGCHSPHLQEDVGEELTLEVFKQIVDRYVGMVSAVLFMGSAYNFDDQARLVQMLDYAKLLGLKTCIWTGENDVCSNLKERLDFLKTGRYIAEKGALGMPGTNQRYVNLLTNESVGVVN